MPAAATDEPPADAVEPPPSVLVDPIPGVLPAPGPVAVPRVPAEAPVMVDDAEAIPVTRREMSRGVYMTGDTIVATVGRAIELELDQPVDRIVMGRQGVVGEIVMEPRVLYLVAQEVGSTNIFLLDRQGRVFQTYEVIVEADMGGLRRALSAVLPDSRLDITPTQGGVVLSGQVSSPAEAANAATVAGQFVGQGGAVVNSLRIAGDQQVLLRVRVAEMNRTARKYLSTSSGNGLLAEERVSSPVFDIFQFSTGVAADVLGTGAGGVGGLVLNEAGIDEIVFDTLEDRGLVRLLAEPSLTAISGETANFLAGGEFPVYAGVDTDTGTPIFNFKEFGVKLSFTPVVLSNNAINLRINTEVSRIAEENAIAVAGFFVPGLSTRRAESTVMLPSGGSLMIAGLLQTEDRKSFQGVPGLMDLPVLGALFRSQDFRTDRSELVVTVQAFKVRPREFGPDLALPTDGFRPSDDLDMYLLGRLHQRYSNDGDTPPYTVAAPVGYIME
jgi:pilus assembly protein CpaC